MCSARTHTSLPLYGLRRVPIGAEYPGTLVTPSDRRCPPRPLASTGLTTVALAAAVHPIRLVLLLLSLLLELKWRPCIAAAVKVDRL